MRSNKAEDQFCFDAGELQEEALLLMLKKTGLSIWNFVLSLGKPEREHILILLAIFWVALIAVATLCYAPSLLNFVLENTKQTTPAFLEANPKLKINEYLERLREYQTIGLSLAAGIVALFGLFLTQRRLDHNRKEHRTQRFKDAVELLGHAEMDVRQGAIFSLQGLMQDHPEEYGVTICHLLAAYINNRGGQVTEAEEKRKEEIQQLEDEYNEYCQDPNNHEPESFSTLRIRFYKKRKAIEARVLFSEHVPTTSPYTDLFAAMQVLSNRTLPKSINEQILFNLDKINWVYFHNDSVNILKVYSGNVPLDKEVLNLTKKNFKGAYLSNVVCSANMQGCIFENAEILNCNFSLSNLNGSNFRNVNLIDSKFQYAQLEQSNFSGADIVRVDLKSANMSKSQLNQTHLREVDFEDVNLKMALLSIFTVGNNVSFIKSNLLGAYRFIETRCADTEDDASKLINSTELINNRIVWNEETIFPDGKRYYYDPPEERGPGWQPRPVEPGKQTA